MRKKNISETFRKGDEVVLVDLTSEKGALLNGSDAVVVGHNSTDDKYTLYLSAHNKTIKCAPHNLKLAFKSRQKNQHGIKLGLVFLQYVLKHPGIVTIIIALVCLWFLTPLPSIIASAVCYFVPRKMDIDYGRAYIQNTKYRLLFNDRVKDIGQNLLQHIPSRDKDGFQFSFEVIDSPEINAYAYPGGPIFITSAMLNRLSLNDNEVAAVLGHEIGHIIHRHSIKNIIINNLLSLVISALTYEDNDGYEESFGEAIGEILPVNYVNHLAKMSYSRGNEYEADDFGWTSCQYMPTCKPSGMISMFEKLAQLTPSDLQWWESTHPGTQERIEVLRAKYL